MRRLLLALLLLSGPAWADSGMMMGGVSNRQMPLDAIGNAATDCYSIRRLRTAYTANKAFNVVRASDSATTDIGFRADGSPDTATLTTFLNATTGKFVTSYDQCGARDLTQATDANRPAVVLSCLGTAPCWQVTSTTTLLAAASNITPATGVMSYSVVGNRSAGTGLCPFFRPTGSLTNNSFSGGSGANIWRLAGNSATFTAAAADATWHAGQAVNQAGSNTSDITIDGTDTAGITGNNTTAGAPAITGAASTTCQGTEVVFWDNIALTASQRSYLNRSQRIGFGF